MKLIEVVVNNKSCQYYLHTLVRKMVLFSLLVIFNSVNISAFSQKSISSIYYIVSFPKPEGHTYHLELHLDKWSQDSVCLKMPNWMPGYYQIMNYANDLENMLAKDQNGNLLPVERINNNSWSISGTRNKSLVVTYTIRTKRQFVANSYVDKDHAYLVPGNTFLYVKDLIKSPVLIKLNINSKWNDIATGLELVNGQSEEFIAPDFDILYDCPILIGNLEELPVFEVMGVKHRFVGYNIGNFDRASFIKNLKRTVQTAVDIFGDVPYKQYTFIAIGPGRGGIEHLNNTTVSFSGNELDSLETMNRIMSFLAHEYFHHYNVKRIRPFELGPFDYDNGNRTNLLWFSEGLTVYYEYLIMKRAGLINRETMFSFLNENLNILENDSGRFFQSLSQASYNTWDDGPFGTSEGKLDKSISVYNKGAIIGMLLDFKIRKATKNNKSLDDVMRRLYWKYYKEEERGFTDAELQKICEQIAGISLTGLFEYVYTTKEIDYAKYLNPVGLKIDKQVKGANDKTRKLRLNYLKKVEPIQSVILDSWLGE